MHLMTRRQQLFIALTLGTHCHQNGLQDKQTKRPPGAGRRPFTSFHIWLRSGRFGQIVLKMTGGQVVNNLRPSLRPHKDRSRSCKMLNRTSRCDKSKNVCQEHVEPLNSIFWTRREGIAYDSYPNSVSLHGS